MVVLVIGCIVGGIVGYVVEGVMVWCEDVDD